MSRRILHLAGRQKTEQKNFHVVALVTAFFISAFINSANAIVLVPTCRPNHPILMKDVKIIDSETNQLESTNVLMYCKEGSREDDTPTPEGFKADDLYKLYLNSKDAKTLDGKSKLWPRIMGLPANASHKEILTAIDQLDKKNPINWVDDDKNVLVALANLYETKTKGMSKPSTEDEMSNFENTIPDPFVLKNVLKAKNEKIRSMCKKLKNENPKLKIRDVMVNLYPKAKVESDQYHLKYEARCYCSPNDPNPDSEEENKPKLLVPSEEVNSFSDESILGKTFECTSAGLQEIQKNKDLIPNQKIPKSAAKK